MSRMVVYAEEVYSLAKMLDRLVVDSIWIGDPGKNKQKVSEIVEELRLLRENACRGTTGLLSDDLDERIRVTSSSHYDFVKTAAEAERLSFQTKETASKMRAHLVRMIDMIDEYEKGKKQ